MGELGRPPVMLDIVEEHFDELDFLGELREANVFTPDWDLAWLAYHEDRCEAHLDGLRLAELHGTDVATAKLASGEFGAALAATLVLGHADQDADRPQFTVPIAAALRAGDPPAVDGIRRALRHGVPKPLWGVLRDLAAGADPLRAAAAIDVLAFVRADDVDLHDLLASPVPAARTLAFGAAARLGRIEAGHVLDALDQAEPSVRRAALRAGAVVGVAELCESCRAAASRPTDPDPEAVRMLGVLGDPADETLLRRALERPELAKTAVQALGALGRASAVPLLLELARDKVLGVPAAFAYQRLTGFRDAFGEKPFPPPPVAEGEDEPEDLPPAPDAMAADWQRRGGAFGKDKAWQFGHEIPAAALPAAFDVLPLHARGDVWLRLRARRASLPDLELEALAVRQRR
jgi:uncharacterized protein (TIGR02270 family)